MSGTCRYGARCRFLHSREDSADLNRGPWASDPAASLFSPSASSPFDTKTEDSHGIIGEAKSAGSSRELRHEQAVLSFLGIAPPKLEQKQQADVCKFSMGEAKTFSSQPSWADLAAKAAKTDPPPMPPPNLSQNPEASNDATFSGLFGARWGTF